MPRPSSDMRQLLLDRLRQQPCTMRELCAGLQLSMKGADNLLQRLAGQVTVAERRRVDYARRPVAVYTVVDTGGGYDPCALPLGFFGRNPGIGKR